MSVKRLRLEIRGLVQGVGFRPFVYRLAREMGLKGWVLNDGRGVRMEVEGAGPDLASFEARVERELPQPASIRSIRRSWLEPLGDPEFEIRDSALGGDKTALVLPDLATCPDCLREIFDPSNRRFRYPFTNCTHCGPRFSIIESLPYDRPRTSMKDFRMCPECRAEYDDPRDRRFHAQPNACPACGPRLELWDASGKALAGRDEALRRAAEALRRGSIVAVKGLGGFHLMADARNGEALSLLRARKRREEKPFALMVPDLASAARLCRVSAAEAALLKSRQAPIVLLGRRGDAGDLASSVAPGNPDLGLMLPSNPLHHLLMAELGFPVVATSGNLSDEPICTDEGEALRRLGGIADLFLAHDRPVVRPVDDSVARVVMEVPTLLRRARGFAPLPVPLGAPAPRVLALGGHLKGAVALALEGEAFVSQHLGDLETPQAFDAFTAASEDLRAFYGATPDLLACDAHPDYLYTQHARELGRRLGIEVREVQHHVAHAASCMADNGIQAPCLGVAWDGSGWGPDGTVWGGEFLAFKPGSVARVACLRRFPLPGGAQAVREPRRSALGLLWEMFGPDPDSWPDVASLRAFQERELGLLRHALDKGLNTPLTSSAGRLFDAASSLLGLRQVNRFEGQAAMDLGFAVPGDPSNRSAASYPFAAVARRNPGIVLDWGPMMLCVLNSLAQGSSVAEVATRFHNTLVEMILSVARRVGMVRVALSGGCFQNPYLLERAVGRLKEEGFHPYWQRQVPCNDGGIALGQVEALARGWTLRAEETGI